MVLRYDTEGFLPLFPQARFGSPDEGAIGSSPGFSEPSDRAFVHLTIMDSAFRSASLRRFTGGGQKPMDETNHHCLVASALWGLVFRATGARSQRSRNPVNLMLFFGVFRPSSTWGAESECSHSVGWCAGNLVSARLLVVSVRGRIVVPLQREPPAPPAKPAGPRAVRSSMPAFLALAGRVRRTERAGQAGGYGSKPQRFAFGQPHKSR